LSPVVKTFKCPHTQELSKGTQVSRFANIAAVARRKLRQLDIANQLSDLRVPPGNRLEALKGDRAGQWGNIVFASMISSASASVGLAQGPKTLKLWIIIE
jgi:plasmid maintenance system killer protein